MCTSASSLSGMGVFKMKGKIFDLDHKELYDMKIFGIDIDLAVLMLPVVFFSVAVIVWTLLNYPQWLYVK